MEDHGWGCVNLAVVVVSTVCIEGCSSSIGLYYKTDAEQVDVTPTYKQGLSVRQCKLYIRDELWVR